MTAADILNALGLPPASLVDRRVPKRLLMENGAPTAADRRAIDGGIEHLLWVAALKPATVAVPLYRDEQREYLEIAVLRAVLRPDARERRLLELVHRAIPYPLVLVSEGMEPSVSLAHKRWSQNESGSVVLDGDLKIAECEDSLPPSVKAAFLASLHLGGLPRQSLFAAYDALIDAVVALEAARLTGTFSLPTSKDHAIMRQAALAQHRRLADQAQRLRAAADREKQTARLVRLNLELKRLDSAISELRERMR